MQSVRIMIASSLSSRTRNPTPKALAKSSYLRSPAEIDPHPTIRSHAMPSALRKPIPRARLCPSLHGDECRETLVFPAGDDADPRCVRKLLSPASREQGADDAALELQLAMQDYKRFSGRMFPTWCEVLEVLCNLGYAKPADN